MKSEMIEDSVGNKRWRLPNGDLHRENNLPAYEGINGAKEWWLNGKLHRENNLPAAEYISGSKIWYVNGLLHRDNGPAIIFPNGTKRWYIEDIHYSEEEYNEKVKDYKVETTSIQKNNSYSQGYRDGHSGLRWL